MQQRQLRLGDILDDYCPRERRVTNHAVVAMVGMDVKQTRCTTCEAEHEFKHGKVPRQRRKAETPAALYSQVLAGGPKRVAHEPPDHQDEEISLPPAADAIDVDPPDQDTRPPAEPGEELPLAAAAGVTPADDEDADDDEEEPELDVAQGPAHRRLIRATLPRQEGQPPPTRPAPEFTIRQPTARPGRFRPRQQRGPSPFHTGPGGGNRPGNMGGGGNGPRHSGGRPPMPHAGRRHGPPGGGGRKRSK
jgi:hypothetical protein